MNITEVEIYKLTDSKTLALASITLNNEFVITGLKVVDGANGLFVAMPSKKNTNENSEKQYSDIPFPITKQARETIQSAVLDKFNEDGFVNDTAKEMYGQIKAGQDKENDRTLDVGEDDLPF